MAESKDSRRYFSDIMNMEDCGEMETEEEDEEKANLYNEPMRRNLLTVFEKSLPAEICNDKMSVFLRVRPFSAQEAADKENQGCVEVQNDYMVTANAPRESHTYRAQLYGLNKAKHNFTFSRVFPESTSQKQFFNSTMLKLVQDFIEGQNCLVFTYGVTNSGKTYTIQGNPRDAGVLPRGLDVLFNSISGKQWPGGDLKPHMFCDVVKLTEEEVEKENKIKEQTMKLNSSEDLDVMTLLGDDASSDQSVMNATGQSDSSTSDKKGSFGSQDFLDVENRDREDTTVDVAVQGQIRFSVWVSFAEIYNEQIFDLLEPIPKKKNARRPVLKLSEDRRGSPYIKGLKEINVTSADEAYKLLTIGQRNLKTACTRLNHCSSRSHCIFNIKIIRVPDKGNPKMARVSMLSLCDLAGSERHSKTHATGERLKEAGNINTSLLTLGRCIDLLRYNQQHKDKDSKIIPFRESRLTRLFQNFFCGRGKAAMIVNVSQCASMFDETLNVFKFSAIAKQVVMPPKPVEKPPEMRKTKSTLTRASSICWDTGATPRASRQSHAVSEAVPEEEDVERESEEDSDYVEQLEEHVEELENFVKVLKQERQAMKREQLNREVEIRREVCQEMQEQFVKIEYMYDTMLQETRQEHEELLEKKLQLVMDYTQPSKRPRLKGPDAAASTSTSTSASSSKVMVDDDDEWVSSLLLHQEKVKVQEKDAELAEMRGRVTELEFQVADMTRKHRDLADKAETAQQARLKAEQDCAQRLSEAERLRDEAVKSTDDIGQSVLLDTLGKQLQESKDRLKQQEKEMEDLNEMLTDAGETFHQKEEEIGKLKQVIEDDEEKMKQQMETIRELRTLLEESKLAVEDSEKRLEAKNQSITDMKDELSQLETRLKEHPKVKEQPQGDAHFHTTALKKCEEELAIAKNRLKHEEEDFQQRQKALIHGYTAEINNLKSQMALLKSRNLGKCVATSPMRVATPEKSRSPARIRRRKVAGGESSKGKKKRMGVAGEMEESFHHVDLPHLLKDFCAELQKSEGLPAELRNRAEEVQQTVETLQHLLEAKDEAEARLEQTQADLVELQGKFEGLSSASTDLQRQLDNKKELHTELTDNQSETAELRQKLCIAQSSAADLETLLTAANHQKLAAEASKAQVVTELKDLRTKLDQTEASKAQCEAELADLGKALNSTTENNDKLQEECESYRLMVDVHTSKVQTLLDEKQEATERARALAEQAHSLKAEAGKATEKVEELETVMTELRSMLNQASGELQSRREEAESLARRAEESDRSTSSNENLLKSALSEANCLLQERTLECDRLRATVGEAEASVAELRAAVEEKERGEREMKAVIDRKMEEFASQAGRVEEYVKEVSAMKQETSAALLTSQRSAKEMEKLQAELKEKQSDVERHQSEISEMKKRHEEEILALESGAEKLQSELDKQASESNELHNKESLLKEATTRVQEAEKAVEEKEAVIAELKTKISSLEASSEEKDKHLAYLTSSDEGNQERASGLEGELREAKEQKKQAQELTEDLQRQLTEKERQHEGALKEAEEELAKQKEALREAEERVQSTQQAVEELGKSEEARLHKLQSLEKAQKEAKRLQDKKLADIRQALDAKEREVRDLQEKLQERGEGGGAQLGESAALEMADLRSQLHMEKALTHKHKASVESLGEENAELQEQIDSLSQELEKLQKEKANLVEEARVFRAKVCELEEASSQAAGKLEGELEEYKTSVAELAAKLEGKRRVEEELEEYKGSMTRLKAQLEERERAGDGISAVGKESLNILEKSGHEMEANLVKDLAVEVQTTIDTVNKFQNAGPSSKRVQELTSELDSEKLRSLELQKQITALSTLDTAEDGPGTSRRLRKEKIQAESELIAIRFEKEKLQKQVETLLNSKVKDSSAQPGPSSSASCSCGRSRSKATTHSDSWAWSDRESVRQDFEAKCLELQLGEAVRQRLDCELLEVRSKLTDTETELTELQAKVHRLEREAKSSSAESQQTLSQPASLSSSQQREAYNLLHAELEKSQQREASLRKELQMCSERADPDQVKLLEEQLAEKTAELDSFRRETEQNKLNQSLSRGENASNEDLQHQVAMLSSQLETKEQALAEKKRRLAEVQAELNRSQQQCKIAKKDLKANEEVIQRLKDTMIDQEETMEKQDTFISYKNEEIRNLTAELETLNDRHQRLLSQESDAGKELRNLTCLHVRLEEEKKLLSASSVSKTEENARLTSELAMLQAQSEAAALKVKAAESAREALEREVARATQDRDTARAVCLDAESERKGLEKKLSQVEEERREMEKELRSLQSSSSKGNKVSESLETQLAATKKELAKVKKAYERDTKIYLEKEAESKSLKHKLQALEKEFEELKEREEKGQKERQVWREEKDKLVAGMENLLQKQSADCDALRQQLEEDQKHYGKLLDEERTEKQELKRQLKVLQRAKDSIVADMRHSNYQLQVELALAQGQQPPPEPPPPQHYSFRVNESEHAESADTSNYIEIDATPPIAIKNLRKSRKRTSTNASDSSAGSSRRRKVHGKQCDKILDAVQETQESAEKSARRMARVMEQEEKSAQSPLTRSARKILQLISPDRGSKNVPAPTEAEEEDMQPETSQRRSRKKAKKEDMLPPPFECMPFEPETRKSSRLRERRQTTKRQ